MLSKNKKQLRITIPKWIAELKGWNQDSNLQIIPVIRNEKDKVSKETIFIIKEVIEDNKKKK